MSSNLNPSDECSVSKTRQLPRDKSGGGACSIMIIIGNGISNSNPGFEWSHLYFT